MKLAFILLIATSLSATGSDRTQALLAIQDAIRSGNLDAATRSIDLRLRENPTDGGLWNLRGVVFAQRNDLASARRAFAEAVRLSPSLKPAWQNLARACQAQGSDSSATECAENSWRQVLRFDPKDAEAHISLAFLYEQGGNFERSLHELDAERDAEKRDLRLSALDCLDLAALGHTKEALALAAEIASHPEFGEADFTSLERALDAPQSAPVAVALLEALQHRGAASLPSWQRLAAAYERVHRNDDARKVLEQVVVLDPKNVKHLIELARLADASKNYEEELGYLAHARDLDPSNPNIEYLFGLTAVKMNLPIEARKSFEKALSLDPSNAACHYELGLVILTTRQANEAVAQFEKYLAMRPNDARGHFALGVAEFSAGDYDAARREFAREYPDRQMKAEATYYRGRIANVEGDRESAARLLQQALALSPSLAEAHTELARVYVANKDFKSGMDQLNRALHFDPTSFRANSDLLALYERTHDARAEQQKELVKNLDAERSRRAELMLRTIEVVP